MTAIVYVRTIRRNNPFKCEPTAILQDIDLPCKVMNYPKNEKYYDAKVFSGTRSAKAAVAETEEEAAAEC